MTHTLIPENANQNKVLQSRRENEKASERKLNMLYYVRSNNKE